VINFLALPLTFAWFIYCLSETNRANFEFAEGEFELVSGFNVKSGGGKLALIFFAGKRSICTEALKQTPTVFKVECYHIVVCYGFCENIRRNGRTFLEDVN